MRKLLFILMAALVLTSCGKDGNDPEVTYTVTFNADGGTPAPQSQTIKAGETAIVPTSPTKQGYVFLLWHLSGSTTAYNFATPLTSNITLQAKWESEAVAEYWQVAWELSGGTWPASGDNHATQVVKGGTLAEPNAPAKAGKTFDGWYKEASLTNKINFPYNVSNVTANFKLYAKWVDPAAEYWNITWELNGGAWSSAGDNHVNKVEKGTTLVEPVAPVKDGSSFDGWYKEAALTNKVAFPATVTGNFKLYAKWSANSSQEEVGITIDGVIWATRNVGAPGKFVKKPEDAGMFYQWGKKVGWSSANPLINSNSLSEWDKISASGDIWLAENDPCPPGWRVPTNAELSKMYIGRIVPSTWTTLNGIKGRVFGTAPNTIFLPASGKRDSSNGSLSYAGDMGAYWGNGVYDEQLGWVQQLTFSNSPINGTNISGTSRLYGNCIRCVKDISR